MDFYPNTLESFIEKNPISLIKKLKILQEICQGLLWLKYIGICHRDIKPLNVMIDSDMNVKIIDFGSCCPNTLTQQEPNGFRSETNRCTSF